ncbi:MAG: DUF72 domain-containing protein [Gemmatimonadaceae bacterium]
MIRIGTQGWNYDAWIGPFYPEGSRPTDFLGLYARAFDTVEVDSTFYAIPSEKVIRRWAERTPAQFRFALKLPQQITHEYRLRNVEYVVQVFFDRARILGDKLGPVLVQLGPDFGPSELPALEKFLPLLPDDLRIAVEFRQSGWITDPVMALLRSHAVALAVSDGRWIPRRRMLATVAEPTAPFVYARWMGPNRAFVDYSRIQADRSSEIAAWAHALAPLSARGIDVYGYINNHFSGHSPATARDLQRLFGLPSVDPGNLGDQIALF